MKLNKNKRFLKKKKLIMLGLMFSLFIFNPRSKSIVQNKVGILTNYVPLPSQPHGKIFIDDVNTTANWNSFPNKTGSGTEENPYIIQGYSINAGGIGSGIVIQNSVVKSDNLFLQIHVKDFLQKEFFSSNATPSQFYFLNSFSDSFPLGVYQLFLKVQMLILYIHF